MDFGYFVNNISIGLWTYNDYWNLWF